MKSRTKPALRVVPAAQVQLSLAMDGVLRDVQHAFYGLCVNAGKQVLAAMMEADRVALCGAKGVPDARRRATRGGHVAGAVVLGGQRIGIKRPRARSIDKGELRLATYEWAAQRDPLDAATLAAVAAGVSTRRYAGTLDELPPPEEALSVSKSAVSRRFVALSQEQLLREARAMIERHWDGIAALLQPENKVSLGFVEGPNNKIRVVQRRAYGLRDEEYLSLKVPKL